MTEIEVFVICNFFWLFTTKYYEDYCLSLFFRTVLISLHTKYLFQYIYVIVFITFVRKFLTYLFIKALKPQMHVMSSSPLKFGKYGAASRPRILPSLEQTQMVQLSKLWSRNTFKMVSDNIKLHIDPRRTHMTHSRPSKWDNNC